MGGVFGSSVAKVLSGDGGPEDNVVEEDVFDDVDENECVELPDVDLDDVDEAGDNEEEDLLWDDGRSGLPEMNGFLDEGYGVVGAVDGGVGIVGAPRSMSSDDDGFSSSR